MLVKRLQKLADKLKTVPRDKFDIEVWMDGLTHYDNLWCAKPNGKVLGDCGTTGCAMGWACTIPSFKRAGLKYNVVKGCLTYKGNTYLDAAVAFFKIDRETATSLFLDSGYNKHNPTPKQVAKKIEKGIKKYERQKTTTVSRLSIDCS